MREIKFRAWNRNRKTWLTIWIEQGQSLAISDGLHNRIDLEPWQQFTGLHDKNGKEIWEGDILKHDLWKSFVVEWDSLSASFRAVRGKETDKDFADLNMGHAQLSRTKIIGNIYENPELLKTGSTLEVPKHKESRKRALKNKE